MKITGAPSILIALIGTVGTVMCLGVSTTLDHVNPPSKITTPDWNTLKTVKLSNASFSHNSNDDNDDLLIGSMYTYKVTGVTDIKESVNVYMPEQPKIKNNEFSGKYMKSSTLFKNDDADRMVVVQTKAQYDKNVSEINKFEINTTHDFHAFIEAFMASFIVAVLFVISLMTLNK